MNFSGLFCVEFRRLLLSKWLQAVSALCFLTPLTGYKLLRLSAADMLLGKYIANPVLAGAVTGGILWALLALYEGHRIHKARMDELSKTVILPVPLALARTAALITLSVIVCIICGLLYLPYTIKMLGVMFDPVVYTASFLIFMMPTWIISILIISALYQITFRTDTAALFFLFFIFLNIGSFFTGSYFLQWLSPLVVSFSDSYSNITPLRIGLYTRLMWIFLSAGLFIFSLLCIRRYQKNLRDTLFFNLRRPVPAVLAAILFSAGILMWVNQPFIDRGSLRYDVMLAEKSRYQTDTTVTNASLKLSFNTTLGFVNGILQYNIIETDGKQEDCFFLNPGYRILRITLNGEKIPFTTERLVVNGVRKTSFVLPSVTAALAASVISASNDQMLVIEYSGYVLNPRYCGSYIIDEVSKDFIQLMMIGNSVPWQTSFHFDSPDKESAGSYKLELTLPDGLVPMVNYSMMSEYIVNAESSRTWHGNANILDNENIDINITAARFNTENFNAAGMNINFVYSEKQNENMKKYDIAASIAEVLNFGTANTGTLPFSGNDGQLLMLVHSGISGGFGFAMPGVIQWSEQSFSPLNLDDAMAGADAAELFVHEVIHLWWGMTVPCEDDGLWSSEGLTVYTTYRFMEEKYGTLYAKQCYIDDWQAMVNAQNRSFYNRRPEYLTGLPGIYKARIENINNINKYHRMPLMILEIEKILGREKLDKILQNIQMNHAEYDLSNPLTYKMFLEACGLQKEDIKLGRNY